MERREDAALAFVRGLWDLEALRVRYAVPTLYTTFSKR
jgi:hypothetical protein